MRKQVAEIKARWVKDEARFLSMTPDERQKFTDTGKLIAMLECLIKLIDKE